jgi:hypothetical protein
VRQRVAVLVLTAVSALAVGCNATVSGRAVPADKSGPLPQTPVAVEALDGLLLDARQVDDALNATSMKVWFSAKAMWDWSSSISDKDCLPLDGPAQDKVYAGTGWTTMRGQRLDDSVDDSKTRNHNAIQAVVAYPPRATPTRFTTLRCRAGPRAPIGDSRTCPRASPRSCGRWPVSTKSAAR